MQDRVATNLFTKLMAVSIFVDNFSLITLLSNSITLSLINNGGGGGCHVTGDTVLRTGWDLWRVAWPHFRL
jgi:hypothetical protein